MSFLSLSKLKKTYPDGTEAVMGLDLEVEAGELIVLLGPSGCGKTTILRMIAGLETVTAGTVRLAGKDVTHLRPAQRDVGLVFQFYALYPHLSVAENIAFPLKCVGVPKPEREERLGQVVERLGLQHLLNRYPGQLSGGDQQRVSLARAMIRRPSIYLMDEPLGTLDADQRREMREFIRTQQLGLKITTIYVTHDQEEAMSLADRIVVMEDGLIRQLGTPHEVYNHPADTFVAEFVGSPGMNFIHGQVVDAEGASRFVAGDTEFPLPAAHKSIRGEKAALGIRPEYIRLDDKGPLAGTVATVEFLGAAYCLHVDTPCGRLVVRTGVQAHIQAGDKLRLRFSTENICVFSGKEQRLVK